jgi:hypothetical protein
MGWSWELEAGSWSLDENQAHFLAGMRTLNKQTSPQPA